MLEIQIIGNDDGGYDVEVLDMRDGGGSRKVLKENLSEQEARKLTDALITMLYKSLV